jgi:hypothetical protein
MLEFFGKIKDNGHTYSLEHESLNWKFCYESYT